MTDGGSGAMDMNSSYWILFAILAYGIVDLWLILSYGPEASFSVTFHKTCAHHPIIAFLLGLLVGHVLWPLFSLK